MTDYDFIDAEADQDEQNNEKGYEAVPNPGGYPNEVEDHPWDGDARPGPPGPDPYPEISARDSMFDEPIHVVGGGIDCEELMDEINGNSEDKRGFIGRAYNQISNALGL